VLRSSKNCCENQSWNYKNLTNGLKVTGVNQLVVGDLTYLKIGVKIFYLFLLTDIYSMRIVGHCLSDRMRKEEAMKALKAWIKLRRKENLIACIHHTDGGSQYFSHEYLRIITEHRIQISVAKNCLENGYAEQRNGLIKNHFIPTIRNTSESSTKTEITRIIKFINFERKQKNLGWLTPVDYEQKYANTSGPEHVCFDFSC